MRHSHRTRTTTTTNREGRNLRRRDLACCVRRRIQKTEFIYMRPPPSLPVRPNREGRRRRRCPFFLLPIFLPPPLFLPACNCLFSSSCCPPSMHWSNLESPSQKYPFPFFVARTQQTTTTAFDDLAMMDGTPLISQSVGRWLPPFRFIALVSHP